MRHGSLFSGIGGFDLAAQWMGWENVFQVEWDKWCQKVLAKNFPDTLRFGDIVEFNKQLQNEKTIADSNSRGRGEYKDGKIYKGRLSDSSRDSNNEKIGRISAGRIDILTGGFPCQPFSHAGKRKGTDDSRYLWPEMLTTIRILKPSFVVGENVAGLVSMENGKTLDRILSDLANEGYTTEQFIIPACAIGAWHRRDRIWIIGRNVRYPQPKGLEGRNRMGRAEGFNERCENVSDSDNGRLKEQRINKSIQQEIKRETESIKSEYSGSCNGRKFKTWGWQSEPLLGRVANGIPNRVDRLKGLGNAIVPQVAYELFKAIELLITSA